MEARRYCVTRSPMCNSRCVGHLACSENGMKAQPGGREIAGCQANTSACWGYSLLALILIRYYTVLSGHHQSRAEKSPSQSFYAIMGLFPSFKTKLPDKYEPVSTGDDASDSSPTRTMQWSKRTSSVSVPSVLMAIAGATFFFFFGALIGRQYPSVITCVTKLTIYCKVNSCGRPWGETWSDGLHKCST